jgi:amino acid transporter
MLLGVAFIIIGIAIKFSPMMISGFSTAWTAANTTAAFADTGLTDVLSYGPTLIILGFIVAVAIVGFLGVKLIKNKND